jgi:hypothetical protein
MALKDLEIRALKPADRIYNINCEVAILEVEGRFASVEDRLAQRLHIVARGHETLYSIAEHRPAQSTVKLLEQSLDLREQCRRIGWKRSKVSGPAWIM